MEHSCAVRNYENSGSTAPFLWGLYHTVRQAKAAQLAGRRLFFPEVVIQAAHELIDGPRTVEQLVAVQAAILCEAAGCQLATPKETTAAAEQPALDLRQSA